MFSTHLTTVHLVNLLFVRSCHQYDKCFIRYLCLLHDDVAPIVWLFEGSPSAIVSSTIFERHFFGILFTKQLYNQHVSFYPAPRRRRGILSHAGLCLLVLSHESSCLLWPHKLVGLGLIRNYSNFTITFTTLQYGDV